MPVSRTCRRVERETERSLSTASRLSGSAKVAVVRRDWVSTLKWRGSLAQVATKVSKSSGGRHSLRARLPVGSMPTR